MMRKKEVSDDWVWIIDCTIQLGTEKCLVVLGVRLSVLLFGKMCISYEDVEPLFLFPVKNCNGEIIYERLKEISGKTGIPTEIIGDHGSDIKYGIDKFCEEYQETRYVYDIKHMIAGVLKKELKDDNRWIEFNKLAGETNQRIKQTSLSALCSPNQKAKARYMNIDTLIEWGGRIVLFVEKQRVEPDKNFDREEVKEKLGWVSQLKNDIKEWKELLKIINIIESFVKREGLYKGCSLELDKELSFEVYSERNKRVKKELLSFVEQESSKAKPNEKLLGSSEVIESVFGKLKQIEKDQSKSGFTGLILSIPAMVSKTTVEVVQKAMETVHTKDILIWCEKMIGKSVQYKRRKIFKNYTTTEQKWDQFAGVT